MKTPWGMSDSQKEIGMGIICITTPSHGGYFVPNETQKLMKEEVRNVSTFAGRSNSGVWYEEDCDWALVCYSFPDLFPKEAYSHALNTIKHFHKSVKLNNDGGMI